jgi:hypothetical protein
MDPFADGTAVDKLADPFAPKGLEPWSPNRLRDPFE